MRIVAGRHSGRRLVAPDGLDVRPTSDRVREALFNILQHGVAPLDGLTVLDAFAGTGALGLEALSRGAAFATFLDTSRDARAALAENLAALHETDNAELLNRDATRPGAAPRRHDLAFLDPPYGKGLAERALAALRSWLADDAVVVVETMRTEDLALPDGYALLQSRDYGKTRLWFVERTAR